MANVINRVGNILEISIIDSDWDYTETFPQFEYEKGIRIQSIQFNAAAAADLCIIKEGGATGPASFRATGHTVELVDEKVKYFNGARLKPFLDFSAGAYDASATLLIQLWENP